MTDKLELRCPRGTLDKIISIGLNAVKDQEVCIQSQIKDSKVVVTQDNQVYKAGSAELKALTPEQLKNA
jgi:leucyl aminopeptidase (aminopeptidase T)